MKICSIVSTKNVQQKTQKKLNVKIYVKI